MSSTNNLVWRRRVNVLKSHVNGRLQDAEKPTISLNDVSAQKEARTELRMLENEDYDKGFLLILSQLATVGDVSKDMFKKRMEHMKNTQNTYFTVVVEDLDKKKIIATASLIVELKFAHGCSKVGHIEDVVVDETYRGYKLGKRVIEELKSIATKQGCYKTILDCSEKNVPFYQSCGFVKKELQMRFDNPHE
ncbi:glucosamine-phosphate N-acetyltransferase [Acrasis kona]|uniref:Glucosamine 6-phosphate N-acetyltransferase n=1 Tax=Acrasis kona TaxID=1008807 RepID=A0AAW2Z222_9EUKA